MKKYNFTDPSVVYILIHYVPVSTTLIENFKLPPIDESMYTELERPGLVTSSGDYEARVNTVEVFKKIPFSTALDDVVPKMDVVVGDGFIKSIPVVYKNKTTNLLDGIIQQNKFL